MKQTQGKVEVTMGLDLQLDGLTAGLAGQPARQKIHSLSRSQREKGMICTSASRETISHPQLECC